MADDSIKLLSTASFDWFRPPFSFYVFIFPPAALKIIFRARARFAPEISVRITISLASIVYDVLDEKREWTRTPTIDGISRAPRQQRISNETSFDVALWRSERYIDQTSDPSFWVELFSRITAFERCAILNCCKQTNKHKQCFTHLHNKEVIG